MRQQSKLLLLLLSLMAVAVVVVVVPFGLCSIDTMASMTPIVGHQLERDNWAGAVLYYIVTDASMSL
jgi:hypothetical protein